MTIYNGVTLGKNLAETSSCNDEEDEQYPTIEDGVTLFPGAKVIGPVVIGKDSIVGTNAVVKISCPACSVVAGVPARVIGRRDPR